MSALSRVVYNPDTTPPTTPGSVTATALSQTAIRIAWAASTDTGGSGLSGYRVYRSTTSGGTYSQIGTDLSTASLSFDDTTLSAGTQRFYRVAAFDGNGNLSAQSSIVNATTQSASGTVFPNFPYDHTRTVVADAIYVDPVSGSNSNNGKAVSEGGTGPKLTVAAGLAAISASSSRTCYLMSGTHTISSTITIGVSGSAGASYELTSMPGHTPVIDGNGLNPMMNLDRSYWTISHLRFQNWANGIIVSENNTNSGLRFFCIQGSTGLVADNSGLIHVWEQSRAPGIVLSRIKITYTGDVSATNNVSGIYFKRSVGDPDAQVDHLDIRGFPICFYQKHGNPNPQANTAICENSFFYNSGSTRTVVGYNASGWIYRHCVFAGSTQIYLSEDDGGAAGDRNIFDHCTIYAGLTGTSQLGGALNNTLTNTICQSLTLQSPSTISSTSNYNLLNTINRYGSSLSLAQWRSVNGSDANSVSGSPTYVGGDITSPAYYALQSGSLGKGAASDGTDIGANVNLVGVQAA